MVGETEDDTKTGLIVNDIITIMLRASQLKKLFKNVDISNDRKWFFFEAIWDQESGTCPAVKWGVRNVGREAKDGGSDDEVELTDDHFCFHKAYGPFDILYHSNSVV